MFASAAATASATLASNRSRTAAAAVSAPLSRSSKRAVAASAALRICASVCLLRRATASSAAFSPAATWAFEPLEPPRRGGLGRLHLRGDALGGRR